MTIGIAWVGTRRDGREHLFLASDSRVRGGHRLDACPKILTLPRSDCGICFAGTTVATYPLMLQVTHAIAAHEPARERSLDISKVKIHVLRVISDLIERFEDLAEPFTHKDVEFLFGGYSWLTKEFRLWSIHYQLKKPHFQAREALTFHHRLQKVAFIGDWGKTFQASLARKLSEHADGGKVYLEPLQLLAERLLDADPNGTIGGPPQIVRITQHMNTRPLCVRWKDEDTLFGRPLFEYENTDYWIIDPFTGKHFKPRKYGNRDGDEDKDRVDAEPSTG